MNNGQREPLFTTIKQLNNQKWTNDKRYYLQACKKNDGNRGTRWAEMINHRLSNTDFVVVGFFHLFIVGMCPIGICDLLRCLIIERKLFIIVVVFEILRCCFVQLSCSIIDSAEEIPPIISKHEPSEMIPGRIIQKWIMNKQMKTSQLTKQINNQQMTNEWIMKWPSNFLGGHKSDISLNRGSDNPKKGSWWKTLNIGSAAMGATPTMHSAISEETIWRDI